MGELKVKVGDKVLYNHWYFGTTEAIATVTKVTPTGRIRIDFCDTQFDKYGRQIGRRNSYSNSSISIPTEKDYKRIRENETISKAESLMKNTKVTYEQEVEIIKILED